MEYKPPQDLPQPVIQPQSATSIYPTAASVALGHQAMAATKAASEADGSVAHARSLGMITGKIKRFKKPLLAVVIILVIAVAGLLIHTRTGRFTTQNIAADGFSYQVLFPSGSQQYSLSKVSYLRAKDPASGTQMDFAIVKSTQSKSDCGQVASDSVIVIDKPSIEGETHNVCYSKLINAYALNFRHDGVWYSMVLFSGSDRKAVIDQKTAKTIASSVSVK